MIMFVLSNSSRRHEICFVVLCNSELWNGSLGSPLATSPAESFDLVFHPETSIILFKIFFGENITPVLEALPQPRLHSKIIKTAAISLAIPDQLLP